MVYIQKKTASSLLSTSEKKNILDSRQLLIEMKKETTQKAQWPCQRSSLKHLISNSHLSLLVLAFFLFPSPVNILDTYTDRLSFAMAFCVCCISVLELFVGRYYINPDVSHLHSMLQGRKSCPTTLHSGSIVVYRFVLLTHNQRVMGFESHSVCMPLDKSFRLQLSLSTLDCQLSRLSILNSLGVVNGTEQDLFLHCSQC